MVILFLHIKCLLDLNSVAGIVGRAVADHLRQELREAGAGVASEEEIEEWIEAGFGRSTLRGTGEDCGCEGLTGRNIRSPEGIGCLETPQPLTQRRLDNENLTMDI